MDSSSLQIGPLRISTMVVTGDLGTSINLQKLLDLFHEKAIPLTWPDEGFLKVEYKPVLTFDPNASLAEQQRAKQRAKAQKKIVIGTCFRDELTKRKKSDNIFFNQSTLVVRRKFDEMNGQPIFKEVNIKLFKNGGIQMTGIPSDTFGQETLAWLSKELQTFSEPVLDGPPSPHKYSIKLINSDYKINGDIDRERLHEILVGEYNLFSSFESTIYQGCDTKYFYNEAAPEGSPEGICPCGVPCSGTGDGLSLGQCKEITISPFHTGTIIITGARRFEQIEKAYVFINKVFKAHCSEVVKPKKEKPLPAPVVKKEKVKVTKPKATKEKEIKATKEKQTKQSNATKASKAKKVAAGGS